MEENSLIGTLLAFLLDRRTLSVLAVVASAAGGSLIFAHSRRPKKVGQGAATYFADSKLLAPPLERPAYSDRMAYLLAEMSSLAYFEFEGTGETFRGAARRFLSAAFDNEHDVHRWLESFADDLLVRGVDSEEFLRKILEKSGFKLLGTVNVDSTQGFVCKRTSDSDAPYLVIAYRGTEKKIDDWLTDANAVAREVGGTRIHKGFFEALKERRDAEGKTALDHVVEILESPDAKDDNGDLLPLFLTGHSLGGALALLTTREIAPHVGRGACYTFGAPRVANYEYFEKMKTPVFRVVNSADIVPRVPPGAGWGLIVKAVQGLSWVSSLVPSVSKLFDRLEAWADHLNGYRHFGDQRYLTDVKAGRFETVKLLSNPPAIDRIVWMGQHLRLSLPAPVVSHGMAIYRKKLQFIANDRYTG